MALDMPSTSGILRRRNSSPSSVTFASCTPAGGLWRLWFEAGSPSQLCECGLRQSTDEPSCGSRRDELLARDFEQPALFWRFHRMAVDAYCLQHADYVRSAKSLAAHLCGLCVAFECGNDRDAMR